MAAPSFGRPGENHADDCEDRKIFPANDSTLPGCGATIKARLSIWSAAL
jgi:hypothetical protein